MILALTGGTGFLGSHILRLAGESGIALRALARRPQPARDGVEWIAGTLDDAPALGRLVAGADAVLHVAGLTNAPDRAGFAAGNIAGTRAMLAAAAYAGVRRFVQISSLSAREPGLSDYGWSKGEADEAVHASGLDWTIVRPPAIYGPGDTAMLDLFRMAAKGFMMLPPRGRLSMIHAEDLARLLLALAGAPQTHGMTLEPDDQVPGGWDHRDFAHAVGEALGRRVRPVPVPAWLLRLAARGDGLVRGAKAKLTPDRARYFCHPDWVVSRDAMPPADLWRPAIDTPAGLRATAESYRAAGWL